jgi:hypothetical protein
MTDSVANNIQSMRSDYSRWVIVALLAAILATQVLILLRMPPPPPTIREIQNAKTEDERTELLLGIPLIRVQGGTIDADISGTVDFAVQNTPLEVQVYRSNGELTPPPMPHPRPAG